ncbi:uncharacterized protein TM35_000441200 [Trypanosoma theileri]|uniref:Uncharacterized protein n=1 Tax=Trypanosoma theileri TaxID=67003 RepID=A0A1X0NI81_9TRYP|nr:uncharacterized protein TM35_000441200 [Trypanosoma theileri]ORC84464.1 hypothetical protein TM35_000441200 [Trypanosoma theileri]
MNPLTCTRDEFDEMAFSLAKRGMGWRLQSKIDSFGRRVLWLEGTSALLRSVGDDDDDDDKRLLVTFFITFNECYCQPQLHFFPECPLDAQELCTWMKGVCFGGSDLEEKEHPIVSMTFCEELQMALWGLHQCDTTLLLETVLAGGVRGNLLELFLQSVGSLVGMGKELVP